MSSKVLSCAKFATLLLAFACCNCLISGGALADRNLAIEDRSPSRYADYPFVCPMTGTLELGSWRLTFPEPSTGTNFASTIHAVPGKHHTGEDWAINECTSDTQDTPIYAINHGVVVYSGLHATANGYVVIIKHIAPGGNSFVVPAYPYSNCGRDNDINSSAIFSYYLHLDEAPSVDVGDHVYKGQQIGQTYSLTDVISRTCCGQSAGGGNRTYCPHLHFEIWMKIKADNDDTYNDSDGYDAQGCVGESTFGHRLAKLVDPSEFIRRNNEGAMIDMMSEVGSGLGFIALGGRALGPSPGTVYVTKYQGSILSPDGLPATWDFRPAVGDWHEDRIHVQEDLMSAAGEVRFGDIELPYRALVRTSAGNDSNWKYYPFADVYQQEWFTDEILEAWQRGLVLGVKGLNCIDPIHGGCAFAPASHIDRAQFITLIIRALERRLGRALDPVGTVPGPTGEMGSWYYRNLQKAYGYLNTNYDDDPIGIWSEDDLGDNEAPWAERVTRQEAARIIFNALRLRRATLWDRRPPWFSDVLALNNIQADWVYACRREGIFEGHRKSDGIYFKPNEFLSRAEAVKALNRAFLDERSWLSFLFD